VRQKHQNLQQKGHSLQNTQRVNYDQSYESKKHPEYKQSNSHIKLHTWWCGIDVGVL
jgi:hypothetical protein